MSVSSEEYDELKRKYEQLEREHARLEKIHESLVEQHHPAYMQKVLEADAWKEECAKMKRWFENRTDELGICEEKLASCNETIVAQGATIVAQGATIAARDATIVSLKEQVADFEQIVQAMTDGPLHIPSESNPVEAILGFYGLLDDM
jgi:hypothetical protein